ncbi:Plasma membrane proteolipid 3 [Lecanosticta acicola]|uniref:Plasma membrane proteolipid 3 n=1 Tax=Lecanosticta acicola TaxID=111012 RepID=A0AAI9E8B0_9PEZI|nr:Plasma membrane proteolipid 3 [Lecanosticta acicola]
MCGSDIFLGLIAILFPPLAVWVKRGICSADSLINIALCCLGFLPGLLHAWYIIAVTPDPTYDALPQQDPERGQVTYYYVQTGQPQYDAPPQRGYGTANSTPNAQFPSQQQQGVVQPPLQPSASSATHTRPLPGGSEEVPPSYQQAVAGDHKIQHD